mgnify:CR=1 FL=1
MLLSFIGHHKFGAANIHTLNVCGQVGWLKGRLSFDDDKDDTEINTIGGGLDSGLGGRVVKLYDMQGNKVAQTTTNGNGEYQSRPIHQFGKLSCRSTCVHSCRAKCNN